MWVLGIALYFFIACVLATVYYLASRKLPFLTDHPFISRVNFGVWVQLFIVGNGLSEHFYFRDEAFYRNGIRVALADDFRTLVLTAGLPDLAFFQAVPA